MVPRIRRGSSFGLRQDGELPAFRPAVMVLRAMFPWSDPPAALRFDRFMEAALHDPERGYYARRIRGVGTRGDFTTTAAIAPSLPRAIARWAVGALRATGTRDLIELGPGEGTLAAAVRARLPWFRRVRLHLVETSSPLRERQQALLGTSVRWHDSVAGALEACDGKACLYSNEFADAFAVRRFRRHAEAWQESHVLPAGETWEPADALPESSIFDRPWPAGQVVEVADSYHHWLEDTLPRWVRGRMLTIDYGARAADLHHRQPQGSLRAYFHHQCLTGPEALARPGHQDLTADVNFTDLVEWTAPWAETLGLRSQREFLAPFTDPKSAADRYAIDPDGPGGAFLVHEIERRR